MKHIILPILIFTIILMVTNIAFAQPPGLPPTPNQAPIDGGLSILAALGGGYAIKKLRDRQRE